jgi:hypothetical protein
MKACAGCVTPFSTQHYKQKIMKQKTKCHSFKVILEFSLRMIKMSDYQDHKQISDNKIWGIK